MPTRVTVNGKNYVSRNWRKSPPIPQFVDKKGNPVDSLTAITADKPESPYRPGIPHVDSDGVTYRVLKYLDPLDGWGTAQHWLKRYPVKHGALLAWVHLGIMDAAMEMGSPTKRYRLRDESRILQYIKDNPTCRIPNRRIRFK